MATPAEEITFDPTNAAPVDSSEGEFDPESAAPVEEAAPQKPIRYGHLSFADKVALAAHDSLAEKQLYLQKVHGKGNVHFENGKLTITKDGVTIPIPDDLGFVAGTAANSPEIAGSIAGGIYGAEAGSAVLPGWGTLIGTLGGAGIGAMTGHSAKEAAKAVAGTQSKTAGEVVTSTLKEGGLGVASEAGGQVVGKLASKALSGRLPSALTGATPESREMTTKAWEGGALPPYASMAPDARKLARIEVDAEKLTGKYAAQDERNQAFVLNEVRKRLEDSGIPNPHLQELMEQLKNPQFAFSGREAGETLQTALRAQSETLEQAVKERAALVDSQLTTRLSNIDHIIEHAPPGALAEDVEAMTRNAKKQFSDWATGAYGKIHQMLGGREVVPVEPIREAARQIISEIKRVSPSSISAATKDLAALGKANASPEDAILFKDYGIELPPGDKITLQEAQRIRTLLREKGDAAALTRNTVKGDHLYLSNAVDQAIQDAAEDPAASVAIKALNATDAAYKKGIAKFNDLTFKQMVKSMKSGMPPDPQKIASLLFVPGQSEKVATIRKVLGEEVFKRAQSADLQNLLRTTQSTNVVGNRMVDGMKLLDYLNRRGDLVKAVHGEKAAADLLELGKSLAARKGMIPPEALAQGDFKGALTQLRAAEQKLDDHLKKNLLAELADPSRTPEDVYRWVVSPGNETRVTQVAKQFGENSPQMVEIRQAALEELARNANINAINDRGNQALERALGQFTKRQQDILFPNGFADDIRKLSDVIKFIYPFKSGVVRDVGMAGMHAGAVLEKPLKQRLYKQAVAALTRFVALHPTVARWVVTGRDPKTPWIDNAARIIEGLTRAEIMNQPLNEGVSNGNISQPGAGQADAGTPATGAQRVGQGNQALDDRSGAEMGGA